MMIKTMLTLMAAIVYNTNAVDITPSTCARVCADIIHQPFFDILNGACYCGDTATSTVPDANVRKVAEFYVAPTAKEQKNNEEMTQQRYSVGADGDFLPAFTTKADTMIQAELPANIAEYVHIAAPTNNGGCMFAKDVAAATTWLNTVAMPSPLMRTQLLAELPSLFLSNNGTSTIQFTQFNYKSTATDAIVQIAVLGAQHLADGSGFNVALVWGNSGGSIVQQYQKVHSCHSCYWVATCCEDNWVPIGLTAAQIQSVGLGLQATLYTAWTSAFPVTTCTPAPVPVVVVPVPSAPHAVALFQPNRELEVSTTIHNAVQNRNYYYEPNPALSYEKLDSELKGFLNSALTQSILHRTSKDKSVQHIQQGLSTLASSLNTEIIPEVNATDVLLVTQQLIFDKVLNQQITKQIETRFLNMKPTDGWFQAVGFRCDNESNVHNVYHYASVYLYTETVDKDGRILTVNMAISYLETTMTLEDIDLDFSSHMYPNGTSITTVTSSHVPKDMTKDDITQLITQLKFISATSILRDLPRSTAPVHMWTSSQNGTAQVHLRAYDFRRSLCIKYGCHSTIGGELDNFIHLAKSVGSTLSSILSKGGGWIHSTSSTEKIISQGSYKILVQNSNSITLPQVAGKDFAAMATNLLQDFPPNDVAHAITYLETLLYSNSKLMNRSWVQVDNKFNGTGLNATTGLAFAGIFTVHMTPKDPVTGFYDFQWTIYDSSFALADRLLMITDKSSWLGGLFSNEKVHMEHLPPIWTADDAAGMQVFLEATMDHIVCFTLRKPTDPICIVPKLPNPGYALSK